MAQTGFTPISTYYTTTASAVPTAGNLVNGELALNINTADGKLFYKDSAGVVQVLATKASASGSFTNLSYTGTLTGGTGVVNLGSGQFYKDASGNVGIGTSTFTFSAANRTVLGINGATSSLIEFQSGGTARAYGIATAAQFDFGTATAIPMTFNTSATERMRIDSSGNVGIGTSSPTTQLHVSNTSGNLANFIRTTSNSGTTLNADSSGGIIAPAGAVDGLQFYNLGLSRLNMKIDSSGNVGIGTSSPVTGLSVNKSSGYIQLTDGTIDYRSFVWTGNASAATGTWSNHPLLFNTNNTERMRIDSSGNLCIQGSTNSSTAFGTYVSTDGATTSRLSIGGSATSGSTGLSLYSTGAGAFRFFVNYAGSINATSIVITAISDQRLKENIKDIDTGLNSIMALKPRRFDWKEGKGQDKKNVAGFIAQEFETVFPECVSTTMAGADGIEYKNINHETLIPTLVKAIQEQQVLIEQLTTRLNALEGK